MFVSTGVELVVAIHGHNGLDRVNVQRAAVGALTGGLELEKVVPNVACNTQRSRQPWERLGQELGRDRGDNVNHQLGHDGLLVVVHVVLLVLEQQRGLGRVWNVRQALYLHRERLQRRRRGLPRVQRACGGAGGSALHRLLLCTSLVTAGGDRGGKGDE